MHLNILYEDPDIIVVWKPVGTDAQSARGLGADMVSLIRNHLMLSKLSTRPVDKSVQKPAAPYVGVVHRLDRPVSGIMVFAKNKNAAAALSLQVSGDHGMEKKYLAVLCGNVDNFVDNPVDNLVDYLLKDQKENISRIVDKGIKDARRAELSCRILETIPDETFGNLALAEITLKTGRHHQIRVQMSGHGMPLWGDRKYNQAFRPGGPQANVRGDVALAAYELTFIHPATHKKMTFRQMPESQIFKHFSFLSQ